MKPSFLLLLLFISVMACAREKKTILYPNGKVQYEYEMEGHLFDGKFSFYYETGKLRMKGQFIRNQKTGLWRVWDEKGLVRSERNYVDNTSFTVVSESDSNGVKIRRNIEVNETKGPNDFNDALFSHRYISIIDRSASVNSELFTEDGFINSLLQDVMKGSIQAFVEDRFVSPVNKPAATCYASADVVALLFKEEYRCSASDQTMSNRLIGICPVVMEKEKRKELGWIYVADIKAKTEFIEKIKDHQYQGTIVKTTIKDPSFRLREVSTKENDLLRLMLIEFEATAILYTIDQQTLASK